MAELDELGLTARLESKTSLGNRDEDPVLPLQYDLGYTVPTNAINYTNLSKEARAYTAVISLSRAQGTFQDFQEAFNYVNNLGGGRILVLPGTYTITKNLTIYSDIQLEGLSTADCILDFNGTTFNLSSVNQSSNINILNLTFMNCYNITTGTIYLDVASTTTIDHCVFTNNSTGGAGYDIYALSPGFVKVTFCSSTGAGTFYYSDSSRNINEVSFNFIVSPNSYVFQGGTLLNGGGRTKYSTNRVDGPVKSVFFGKFFTTTIDSNVISLSSVSTQVCIDIDNVADVKISNNNFTNSQVNGQGIIDISTGGRCFFTSNWILGSKDNTPTVLLTNCDSCHFSANNIDTASGSTGADAIKLVSSTNCAITGNRITSSDGGTAYGVNMPSGSNFNIVVGNAITAVTADTLDGGSGNVIANNS